MKARPRHVEREIAKSLSLFYSQLGMSPVERIPVLGRTGPDIEVNELRLAVDVKSRLQVPKCMLVQPGAIGLFGIESYRMLGVTLGDMSLLLEPARVEAMSQAAPCSQTVLRWLLHMQEWADAGACQAALVLHKPKMMYERSTFILFQKDWREFYEKCSSSAVRAEHQRDAGRGPDRA